MHGCPNECDKSLQMNIQEVKTCGCNACNRVKLCTLMKLFSMFKKVLCGCVCRCPPHLAPRVCLPNASHQSVVTSLPHTKPIHTTTIEFWTLHINCLLNKVSSLSLYFSNEVTILDSGHLCNTSIDAAYELVGLQYGQ